MTYDRETLQAAGRHPAPCARHCEATAFQIEIRRLTAEVERLHIKTIEQAQHIDSLLWLIDDNTKLRAEVARLRMYAPGRRAEHKITPAPHVGPTNWPAWGIPENGGGNAA